MTFEGRQLRGKENSELGRFKDNSETMAYVETLASNDTDYSSKTKKQLVTAAKDMELKGTETKDDLIVLLENNADEKVSVDKVVKEEEAA